MNLNKFFPTCIPFEKRFENQMIMCRYKDTSVGIRKLDFRKKRGMMAAYLTDGQFFSFESIGRIFSVKDLLAI